MAVFGRDLRDQLFQCGLRVVQCPNYQDSGTFYFEMHGIPFAEISSLNYLFGDANPGAVSPSGEVTNQSRAQNLTWQLKYIQMYSRASTDLIGHQPVARTIAQRLLRG